MTITELKQVGRTDGYRLTLDNGAEIRTTVQVIADLSLYTGKELSDAELAVLAEKSALSACKNRALRIIGARAMSEKELYTRLLEKGETPENTEVTVQWLVENRLLNDREYGCMIVRHYAAKGYGAARIKQELHRRFVPRDFWEEALLEMPETDDTIDRLLRSKLRSENPDRAEIKRATDALLRLGYNWGEIKAALERYRLNLEEDYE